MKRVKYLGVYLFPFVLPLPLPMKYSAMALIIMLANLLFLLIRKRDLIKIKYIFNPLVIIFLLFFLTDFFRGILTLDFSQLLFQEVKIIFIIFPIIAMLHAKLFANLYNEILKAFFLGVITYIIIAWGFVIYYYTIANPTYIFDFTDHYVIYVLANEFPLAIHHTYIGLYILFITLVVFVNTIINKSIKLFYGLSTSLFLLLNSFYLGGKSTTVLLILFMLGVLIFSLFNEKKIKGIKYYVISLFLIVIVGVSSIYEWLSISIEQSYLQRKVIFTRSIQIINESFPFGIGKNRLKEIPLNSSDSLGINLIPHNIYLNELIINGIVGEIILLTLLSYLCYAGYKSKIIFLLFSISIILIGFTEDLFSRQRGILFFVFFATVLYNKYYQPQKTLYKN